ncbi:MAG TPA: serine/threonine-protein kinase [Kofleriaceae bacterium]|nr:serine/threonine-protein kinase [Kofleriaceae bacterium]
MPPGDRALTTDAGPPVVVAPAFAPGMVIDERYRIEARLGAGGGGTVWRCFDRKLETIVALKIVSSDGDLERWRREVAMARRIAHRNVCRVHDLGETAELRYVTMELVEGDSLRARIGPALPAAEARELFEQIVGGAAAIHAAGVVHRDLKPENVVVARDGRAVIVDFGLAREPRAGAAADALAPTAPAVTPSSEAVTAVLRGPTPTPDRIPSATVTNAGTIVGTPRYMSPEQAAGEVVDARTDVWALGLIGHELLTGKLPSGDEHGRAIAPDVDAKWPGIAAVLRRCLALLPDERHTDARALEQAVRQLAHRRRRWPWVAAAAGVLAIGGVIVATQLSGSRTTRPVPGPYRMAQLTHGVDWPDDMPHSLALSPDAMRFAYTTVGPKLFVRPLAGGAAVSWPIPKYVRPATQLDRPPVQRDLVTVIVAGWFSDGSVAIEGSTYDGSWHVYRVYEDGRFHALYSGRGRLALAVDPVHDRLAIGPPGEAIAVLDRDATAPRRVAALAEAEATIALAWSPDGEQLAALRAPGKPDEPAVLQLVDPRGGPARELWRGPLRTDTADAVVGPLLAWLARDRLALSAQDPDTRETSLLVIDPATGETAVREVWKQDHIGLASAARGTLLLLRGTAEDTVQVRDKLGFKITRVPAKDVQASRLAGWTTDGQLVYLEGPPGAGRIVRAIPGSAATPWPGTTAGLEVPDTVVDNDVIAHLVDPADARKLLVVRLAPDGSRRPLARIDREPVVDPVRCAGDRAPPCVIEQIDGDGTITWHELDPETGAIGRLVARQPARGAAVPTAALSHDGSLLAIVDGGPMVTLVDRATGEVRPKSPSADAGAALHAVGFDPEANLWAASIGLDGRLFGLMTFSRRADGYGSAFRMGLRGDAMRSFGRPAVRGTGSTLEVAVTARELRLDVYRADGL